MALDLVSDIQSGIIVNVAKRTTATPLGLISPYIPTQPLRRSTSTTAPSPFIPANAGI